MGTFSKTFGVCLAQQGTLLKPLLIDTYSGASMAYSLRKVSKKYNGAVIKVRRSSDNAEKDIYFLGNSINKQDLLSFVGTGNGFVSKWYDQSGSGINVVQTNVLKQPKIVNDGVLITMMGMPAIQFDDASGNYLITENTLNSIPSNSNGFSLILVSSASNNLGFGVSQYNGTANKRVFGTDTNNIENTQYDFSVQINTSFSATKQASVQYTTGLRDFLFCNWSGAGTKSEISKNNGVFVIATDQTDAITTVQQHLEIGSINDGATAKGGKCQELIIYPKSMKSVKTDMINDITKSYYVNKNELIDYYYV